MSIAYHSEDVLAKTNQVVLLDSAHSRSVIALECDKRGVVYTDEYATARIDAFNHDPVKRGVICAFGTRVHTDITNKLKQIREAFRFGGDLASKWVETDLVASQPWVLSIISPALIKRFVPGCLDVIPALKAYDRHPDVPRFRYLYVEPARRSFPLVLLLYQLKRYLRFAIATQVYPGVVNNRCFPFCVVHEALLYPTPAMR